MKKYEFIASSIRKRILNKEYTIGDKLPFEYELCEEYAASKQTVKKALEILSAEGLIIRRRGAGTFVKNTDILEDDSSIMYSSAMKGFTKHFDNKDNIENRILYFEVIPANDIISEKLEIDEGMFVYHMARVRTVSGDAHVVEEMFMPVDLLPGINMNMLSGSLYEYFENDLGKKIQDAHIIITAEPSNEKDQELLNLSPLEPIIHLEKVAFLTDGSPFEYSLLRFHYQHFSYYSVLDKR